MSGNSSPAGGGAGIENAAGTATLTNVTVSGNVSVPVGTGLPVAIRNGGTLTVTSSTVTGNEGVGIFNSGGDAVTLKNTILANNTVSDCWNPTTSAGHNLIESCVGPLIGDPTGNIIGVDPLLGPLADNGGPTKTHALLPGSPAINAGSPDCPPQATDQRGVTRPQGAACDIGAFELVLTLTVQIDIKPGSFPNSINLKSEGVIPVAILTTSTFNAANVNSATVRFGKTGTEAVPLKAAMEDVDGDGDQDMIVHFQTQAAGIACGDTSASVTGDTFGGQAIQGTDSINTVGCK